MVFNNGFNCVCACFWYERTFFKMGESVVIGAGLVTSAKGFGRAMVDSPARLSLSLAKCICPGSLVMNSHV